MSDVWPAVIAAASGLGGVAVGGWVSFRLQSRQLAESRRDRLDDVRRETYGLLIQTETRCYNAVLDDQPAEEARLFNELLETSSPLVLLATKEVLTASDENLSAIGDVCRFYESTRPASATEGTYQVFKDPGWRKRADRLDISKKRLVDLMREEIGTSPPT
jgi:hypothetical protein